VEVRPPEFNWRAGKQILAGLSHHAFRMFVSCSDREDGAELEKVSAGLGKQSGYTELTKLMHTEFSCQFDNVVHSTRANCSRSSIDIRALDLCFHTEICICKIAVGQWCRRSCMLAISFDE
jgi:hypothetical protein